MTKFFLGFFSFGWLRGLDFLPPLMFRFFLAPLLWFSGQNKLGLFTAEDMAWYNPLTWGNSETYQAAATKMSEMPFIGSMADVLPGLVGGLEIVGAFLLLIGLAVRWISLPLLGLFGIMVIAALGDQGLIAALKEMLLSGTGYAEMSSTAFTKGVIYFLMLFSLFFMGAGRFFSVDWFLYRGQQKKISAQAATKAQKVVAKAEVKDDPFDLDNTTDNDDPFDADSDDAKTVS